MGRGSKEEDRTIDRVLRWVTEQRMKRTEFARRMDITPQRLNNWKERGMPARECPKAAEILGHSLGELLGLEPEEARAPPPASDLRPTWPFRFHRDRFDDLEPEQKATIEKTLLSLIEAFESAGGAASGKRSVR